MEDQPASTIPVIDVSPLLERVGEPDATDAERGVAAEIDRACRATGFFVARGHGADPALLTTLDREARRFFALDDRTKATIAMATGGRAWRGWFPEGGELTSGRPDRKEGLYFGRDLDASDPRVAAGLPLHGPNRYPADPPGLRTAVDAWMAAMERAGHAVGRGASLALGLAPGWMDDHLTGDPTVLFRIFRYPAQGEDDDGWGVGEHTDYGLLTLLAHDGAPGLQVWSAGQWIDVPAVADGLVVNLGDMLERMTAGRYRSTPHRVRHHGGAGARDRLSFPFFFDPAWDAHVQPIPADAFGDDDRPSAAATERVRARWDGGAPDRWDGTYGDYLTAKVAKVFPTLGTEVGITPT